MSQPPDLPPALLDAALRLYRKAPSSLTMGAVARAAGVSRATLYRHVAGREALLAALVRTGRLPKEAADPQRARVLAAAFRLLLDKGPAQATMGAIAKAAGVNPATLHRRFGTRQALLDAVTEEFGGRRFAWRLGTDPSRDPVEELTDFTRRLIDLAPQLGPLLRFALALPSADRRRFQKLRRASEGTEVAVAGWFAALQSTGFLGPGDPHLLAQSYLGLTFVLASSLPGVRETPALPRDALADFIVSRFLDGARRPRTTWSDR